MNCQTIGAHPNNQYRCSVVDSVTALADQAPPDSSSLDKLINKNKILANRNIELLIGVTLIIQTIVFLVSFFYVKNMQSKQAMRLK